MALKASIVQDGEFRGFDRQIAAMKSEDVSWADELGSGITVTGFETAGRVPTEEPAVEVASNIAVVDSLDLADLVELNANVKYKYSDSSLHKLIGVHKDLQWLFMDLANLIDVKIIFGNRTAEEQNDLYHRGLSTKDGYEKLSNHQRGKAIDFIPIQHGGGRQAYEDRESRYNWYFVIGMLYGMASTKGIKVRSGAKWRTKPENFISRKESSNSLVDYCHIEVQ